METNTVHVVEIGVVYFRKWASSPRQKQEEFWKSYDWWTRVEERDAALNNNQGVVFILDYAGYTLKSMASVEGNEFSLGVSFCTLLLDFNVRECKEFQRFQH